jgi:hypothetical protein
MQRYTTDSLSDYVTVVLGYSQRLADEELGSLNPNQEEALRMVLDAAERLRRLLLEHPPRFVID